MLADPVERGADRGGGAEEEGAGDAVDDDVAVARERGIVGRALGAADRIGPISLDHRPAARPRSPAPCDAGTGARRCPKPTRMPSVRSRNTTRRKVTQQHHGVAARGPQRGSRSRASRPCSRRRPRARQPAPASGMKLASGAADQHEQQQEQGVRHAGHGAARAGADIGRGPGDGAGDADAAEQRRGDVGDALGHQLAVRAVAAAGHAVGHHGREQALDPAQQRERQAPPAAAPRRARARGRAGAALGSPLGMPPKRVPMVSTGRPSAQAASEASATAIRKAGQCGRQRRTARMTPIAAAATAIAGGIDGRQCRRPVPPAWGRSALARRRPASGPAAP